LGAKSNLISSLVLHDFDLNQKIKIKNQQFCFKTKREGVLMHDASIKYGRSIIYALGELERIDTSAIFN